jgi:hypothetical protein
MRHCLTKIFLRQGHAVLSCTTSGAFSSLRI